MEKIILAVDALNPNQQAFDFACFLGRLTHSKITGIFLENLLEESRPVLKDLQGRTIMYRDDDEAAEYLSNKARIEENIASFKNGCINGEVCFSVHRALGRPDTELIEESRFADLLVIDAEISFGKGFESNPTRFVKEVLQRAECPVFIAPVSFDGLDEIVFTYDGSASSLFAIKQFTYLFPQLQGRKVTILQIKSGEEWQDRDKIKFSEWLKEHYTNMHFETAIGNTNDKLFDYLFKKKNIFVVMGSYGRSALSGFFKKSHADPLIQIINLPIFISHH